MFKLHFFFRIHNHTNVLLSYLMLQSFNVLHGIRFIALQWQKQQDAPQRVIRVFNWCHLSLQKVILMCPGLMRLASKPLPTWRSFSSFHLRWLGHWCGWPDGHLMPSQSDTWLGWRSVAVWKVVCSTKSSPHFVAKPSVPSETVVIYKWHNVQTGLELRWKRPFC